MASLCRTVSCAFSLVLLVLLVLTSFGESRSVSVFDPTPQPPPQPQPQLHQAESCLGFPLAATCPSGYKLHILSALYGQNPLIRCAAPGGSCVTSAAVGRRQVLAACSGVRTCTVRVPRVCSGAAFTVFKISYRCVVTGHCTTIRLKSRIQCRAIRLLLHRLRTEKHKLLRLRLKLRLRASWRQLRGYRAKHRACFVNRCSITRRRIRSLRRQLKVQQHSLRLTHRHHNRRQVILATIVRLKAQLGRQSMILLRCYNDKCRSRQLTVQRLNRQLKALLRQLHSRKLKSEARESLIIRMRKLKWQLRRQVRALRRCNRRRYSKCSRLRRRLRYLQRRAKAIRLMLHSPALVASRRQSLSWRLNKTNKMISWISRAYRLCLAGSSIVLRHNVGNKYSLSLGYKCRSKRSKLNKLRRKCWRLRTAIRAAAAARKISKKKYLLRKLRKYQNKIRKLIHKYSQCFPSNYRRSSRNQRRERIVGRGSAYRTHGHLSRRRLQRLWNSRNSSKHGHKRHRRH